MVLLLEYNSRILMHTLKKALESDKKEIVDIVFSDFDGVKFHAFTDEAAPNVFNVSVSWPVIPALMQAGAQQALKAAYGPYVSDPEAGYGVTLSIDMNSVPEDKKAGLPFHISMLKRNLFAAPFNMFFNAIVKGGNVPDLLRLDYRHGESLFLQRVKDRVVVIFKITFVDEGDQLLGKVFLQELAARFPGAPSVAYRQAAEGVPEELEGVEEPQENVGYVSLVLFKAHFTGKKRGSTISNLQTFRNYLHYHIKCSKAFMHTRMRARVKTLLQVLNRAKTEPLVRIKRTAQGKVFQRRS